MDALCLSIGFFKDTTTPVDALCFVLSWLPVEHVWLLLISICLSKLPTFLYCGDGAYVKILYFFIFHIAERSKAHVVSKSSPP
jgi:hypothetical protein